MKVVIAGDSLEARGYLARESVDRRDALVVSSPDDLLGHRIESPEDVVLVGRWWCRGDWPAIQELLRVELGAEAMAYLGRDL